MKWTVSKQPTTGQFYVLRSHAVRYVMCIVPERNNALHDFVDDDTLE